MNRHVLRVALPLLVLCFASSSANAQKSKKSAKPADSGSSMTFDVEETGQAPAAVPHKAKPTAPPVQIKVGPPSKTMERAIKLYEAEDYYSSSIELNKVIEGQSGDDEGNRQRAEFYMGKALFQLKYYSAALSYFDRIVQKGPDHTYYNKTLQWLASLSQHLPDSAGVLDKIGKYTRTDLEQPALESVRDQLFYLLGRYHYSKSNFADALELFRAVPEKSEYFSKAKFFEGMTFVRQYQAKPASDAFKAILRYAIQHPNKANREYEQLANISLARTFYSLHQFQQSVKYYDKVPQESPDWLASLFESSWALFQMDGYSKALGNIHTVNAPYFENEFYPESLILKALIYFERCQFEHSMEAVSDFHQAYPGLKREIDSVVSKHPDNADFYAYILKIKNGEAGLSERVQRAAISALSDKTLSKTIGYVEELDRELKSIEKADPAWRSTAIASTILQDLTLQKSLAANEAGGLARMRLKRLAGEIQELVKQAIKIEYETLNKQKNELQSQMRQEGTNKGGKGKSGDLIVDDEHEKWPFDGEYWKDELGYYRFKIADRCVK